MSRKSKKGGNNRNNREKQSYKRSEHEVSNVSKEVLHEQETQSSYSEVAANVIKTGTVSTLKAISYIAGTGVTVTDKLTTETIPVYLRIPAVPSSVISTVASWVPVEAAGVISMVAPLMTLGNDIRSLDPTGLVDVYLMYNQTKTCLSYTKIAADFAASAIERGSVKDAAVANAQSIADKYIPTSVKNMVGSIFGRGNA